MHWIDALEYYLAQHVRPSRVHRRVTGATVETDAGPPETSSPCEVVGGWWVEERVTVRGNVALHLFPSVA